VSNERATRAEQVYLDLVAEYQTAILNYVYRLVGDADLAEDLTQETYVKAYRSLERLELGDEAAARRRAWLYRIAHNTATDHLRHQSRLRWLPLDAVRHRGAGDPAGAVVDREPVAQALTSLSDDQRRVLLLFSHAGLSAAEVAEVLGVTPAAARKRRQRAREAFEVAYRRLADLEDKAEA
jgi:RNA polymerase sigma-70 factor (ECF subfamily)